MTKEQAREIKTKLMMLLDAKERQWNADRIAKEREAEYEDAIDKAMAKEVHCGGN